MRPECLACEAKPAGASKGHAVEEFLAESKAANGKGAGARN